MSYDFIKINHYYNKCQYSVDSYMYLTSYSEVGIIKRFSFKSKRVLFCLRKSADRRHNFERENEQPLLAL